MLLALVPHAHALITECRTEVELANASGVVVHDRVRPGFTYTSEARVHGGTLRIWLSGGRTGTIFLPGFEPAAVTWTEHGGCKVELEPGSWPELHGFVDTSGLPPDAVVVVMGCGGASEPVEDGRFSLPIIDEPCAVRAVAQTWSHHWASAWLELDPGRDEELELGLGTMAPVSGVGLLAVKDEEPGVLVEHVLAQSAARDVGIEPGMRVLEVDGEELDWEVDRRGMVARGSAGELVEVLLSDGTSWKLERRPVDESYARKNLGIAVDRTEHGLVVAERLEHAADAGVEVGDRIVAFRDEDVGDWTVGYFIGSSRGGAAEVPLTLERDGELFEVVVERRGD